MSFVSKQHNEKHKVVLIECAESYHTWQLNSNCRSMQDPSLFFPPEELPKVAQHQLSVTTIQDFCITCPVREPCLVHALICDEELGVWGGTTPNQRRRFARQLSRKYGSWFAWASNKELVKTFVQSVLTDIRKLESLPHNEQAYVVKRKSYTFKAKTPSVTAKD